MPKSVALSQVECKSMKVKIEDADRKEYCGVYFDVKKAGQADTVMKMDPPQQIFANLRDYRAIVAIKRSKMIFAEENIFKQEIPITDFNTKNSVVKICKANIDGKDI